MLWNLIRCFFCPVKMIMWLLSFIVNVVYPVHRVVVEVCWRWWTRWQTPQECVPSLPLWVSRMLCSPRLQKPFSFWFLKKGVCPWIITKLVCLWEWGGPWLPTAHLAPEIALIRFSQCTVTDHPALGVRPERSWWALIPASTVVPVTASWECETILEV